MQEILEYLAAAGTYFLATADGDQPKVRPIGFCMPCEGRLYFCTNELKDMYKQLVANPRFEICATKPDGTWLRFSGEAVFDKRPELKEKAFAFMPPLKGMYGNPDSPPFALFYAKDVKGAFFSMAAAPKAFAF